MKKCLDLSADRLEAIISVSDKKQQTSDIGRIVTLDLSTHEKEYEQLMFPLNIAFSTGEVTDWMMGLFQAHSFNPDIIQLYKDFNEKIIKPIMDYKMPVIELDKETPKEAVCQIFENVNTGGVPLTVFELITATFAADEYDLRADWDSIKKSFNDKKLNVLQDITGANFLAAMTLLVSYKKSLTGNGAVTCKKRDILRLDIADYKANHDSLIGGFEAAASFLIHQGIYSKNDLPYSSQLIPLAAIFAYDNEKKDNRAFILGSNKEKLAKWYWCGVMGELYGGANEARFALDIADIFKWIKDGTTPDTVNRSSFQPNRLFSMQTRNSAAYKGIMALIMKDNPLDFMSGEKMSVATYIEENTDIHHIFPEAYCQSMGYPRQKWNSVVNKTPIYASSNRSIGGRAPSEYVKTMKNKGLDNAMVEATISSHKVNFNYLVTDQFDKFFIDRSIKILDRIELATGKKIPGRDSEETIKDFGVALVIDNLNAL